VASGLVARAPADGYTLVLLTGGHAVSAAMVKKLAFDPLEDFSWLSVVTKFPFVIATASDSRFTSLAKLVSEAGSAPGTISYSSVGIGSTQHLAGELLQSVARIKLNHIPYRGGSAPLQDVLGRRVDIMFDSVTVTKAQVEAGRLRALAVTSTKRIPHLAGTPPAAEIIPGYEVTSWTGLAAPKGLPAAIATRLQSALARVLADAEVVRQLEATGGVTSPSASSGEMKAFVSAQVGKWRAVVADARITPD
jgi:tripartite-type tricarboxylate transporter receptor subunit TctC